jgi:hypothetical protein
MQFIFIEDEAIFKQLDELREIKPILREIILNCEEVDNLDPEILVTFDRVINHGKIAWREHSDLLRIRKSSVLPTDIYSVNYREEWRKADTVSYSDFLRDLDASLAYYSSSRHQKTGSALSPVSFTQRTFGFYAPMMLGLKVHCFTEEDFAMLGPVSSIAPDCLIISPVALNQLCDEVIQALFPKELKSKKRLEKSRKVCDKRTAAIKGGRRPPLFTRLQYNFLNRTLFKKIRKSLGGNLKEIICDKGPLNEDAYAFFTNAGISVMRPR